MDFEIMFFILNFVNDMLPIRCKDIAVLSL